MSQLGFAILGARLDPYAAAPTMVFRLKVSESSQTRIHTIALRTQIQIEPRQRPYHPAEQRRLLELFGEPKRWGTTLQTVLWTHTTLMVPGFEDRVEVDMPVACSYDFEVSASKYFHALDGGDVPLQFLFSGTVFSRGQQEVQVERVPWQHEARLLLPVSKWRELMDCYYPNSAWLRLGREAFDALHHYKASQALMSVDDAVMALLDSAASLKGERPVSLELAEKVANAVLYEGYVLYPYRASSAKNQVRWQFGVFMPKGYSERDGYEPWAMKTECIIEGDLDTDVSMKFRGLQIQSRTIEAYRNGDFEATARLDVGAVRHVPWDEGVEQSIVVPTMRLGDLLRQPCEVAASLRPLQDIAELSDHGHVVGRVLRTRWAIEARVLVSASAVDGVYRLGVRWENVTPFAGPAERILGLRHALTGLHAVLSSTRGHFVSLTDPPPGLEAAVAGCYNQNTWPVLIGDERRVVLSSPIILSDYPSIAPESPGDLCDATEIDEILTLRIQTMTDEEKREACSLDDRARLIIERSDALPPEWMDRLHGTIRSRDEVPTFRTPPALDAPTPELQALLDGPSPDTATARLGTVILRPGSRVRLHPKRRADAMDMFMAGQIAVVEGILRDVDDITYVAINLEDDPGADIHRESGRFYYYYLDELEPIEE